MITTVDKNTREELSPIQMQTFEKFKNMLAQNIPQYHIAWVHPAREDIIELRLETDKRTYRNNIKAATLAIEIEEKTGVTIIFR
ncbi:MAG: hypothetical protein ACE5I1_00730 [bacterium]